MTPNCNGSAPCTAERTLGGTNANINSSRSMTKPRATAFSIKSSSPGVCIKNWAPAYKRTTATTRRGNSTRINIKAMRHRASPRISNGAMSSVPVPLRPACNKAIPNSRFWRTSDATRKNQERSESMHKPGPPVARLQKSQPVKYSWKFCNASNCVFDVIVALCSSQTRVARLVLEIWSKWSTCWATAIRQ